MAAFALGLLGDKTAVPRSRPRCRTRTPRVRGRAAEALGLIGDTASAPAVGQMVSRVREERRHRGASRPTTSSGRRRPEAEPFALGLFALVRLKAYEPLAAAVLRRAGRSSAWWPVAYALQRIEDPRAAAGAAATRRTPGRYTRAFAARGLGALKDAARRRCCARCSSRRKGDLARHASSAVRALGADRRARRRRARSSRVLAARDGTDPNVRLEAVAALGALKSQAALPYVQDLLTDDWPAMRAAALRAAAAIDPEAFPPCSSGMEPDRHWRVRAAHRRRARHAARRDRRSTRLRAMLEDRTSASSRRCSTALARLKAPELETAAARAARRRRHRRPRRRGAALGQLKPAGGAGGAARGVPAAQADPAYNVRDGGRSTRWPPTARPRRPRR